MSKTSKIFLMLLTVLWIPGCLELYELTQPKSDGSGTLTLRISLPDFPDKEDKEGQGKDKDIEKEIEESFKTSGLKGIELLDKSEADEFGLKSFTLKVGSQKMTNLPKIYTAMKAADEKKGSSKKNKSKKSKEALNELFTKSPYRIKKTKNNSIIITRKFSPPKALMKKTKSKEGKKQEELSKELEETFLNAFRLSFEFMSPTQVISSNAPVQFGNDLRWQTTLGYLVKNPFEIRMEIEATPEMLKNLK